MVDQDFIDELARREERKAEEIATKLRQRDWKGQTTIAPFYPEIGQRTKGGHITAVPGVSIGSQVPFFAGGLLVQVEPFTTPQTFEEHYGINVATMRDLVQRGLVVPIISSDLYRYVGLDYLAPLLTIEPTIVASIRTRHFFLVHSTEYDAFIDEGKRRLTMLSAQAGDWERKYRTGGEAFVTARAKRYARLKVLHPELSERIEEAIHDGAEAARSVIDMLDIVLVDRHTSAFEGALAVDGPQLKQVIQRVPELSPPQVFSAFYAQVAENLLDHVGLSFPRQLTLAQLDELQKAGFLQRAQEVLRELNDAVAAKSDTASERAADAAEYWDETTRSLRGMTKNRELINEGISSLAVAVTGGTSWWLSRDPGEAIKSGLAMKGVMEIPIVKRVRTALAEQAATFLRPRVATLIFELRKDLASFKAGR